MIEAVCADQSCVKSVQAAPVSGSLSQDTPGAPLRSLPPRHPTACSGLVLETAEFD